MFFLLHTPYNTKGWLFHTLYYMSILPLLMILRFEIYSYIQTKSWVTNVPAEYLYAGTGLIILVIIFHIMAEQAARVAKTLTATINRKTTPLNSTDEFKR